MADEPTRIFLNGQPIEVTDISYNGGSFADANPEFIRGLRDVGPFTLTGRWIAANERVCPNCDAIFVVNHDQPLGHLQIGDGPEIPICDACAVALLGAER